MASLFISPISEVAGNHRMACNPDHLLLSIK